MKHKNIKQLDILWQEGIENQTLTGIIKGILEILKLAGVSEKIPIANQGTALFLPARIDVESFLEVGRQKSKRDGFLNGPAILDALGQVPIYQNKERYAVLIFKEKIHWSDHDTYIKIGGCAKPDQAAIFSLAQFLPFLYSAKIPNEEINGWTDSMLLLYTRMIIIHELGHVFRLGLTKKENSTHEEVLNGHCTNTCVMNSRWDIPFYISIQDNPLCPSCLEELKKYFIETP